MLLREGYPKGRVHDDDDFSGQGVLSSILMQWSAWQRDSHSMSGRELGTMQEVQPMHDDDDDVFYLQDPCVMSDWGNHCTAAAMVRQRQTSRKSCLPAMQYRKEANAFLSWLRVAFTMRCTVARTTQHASSSSSCRQAARPARRHCGQRQFHRKGPFHSASSPSAFVTL